MRSKTIVTVTLLAFVAVSIVYLVVQETSGEPTPATARANRQTASTKKGPQTPPAPEKEPAEHKVTVYYFHGNMRCMTCRTIEAHAKEAVEAGFPGDLRDGRLEWKVVNVDQPAKDHYVRDFQLTTRSVVLERLSGGKRKEWKDLQRVWELVRGDKEVFLQYIQDETRTYLEELGP